MIHHFKLVLIRIVFKIFMKIFQDFIFFSDDRHFNILIKGMIDDKKFFNTFLHIWNILLQSKSFFWPHACSLQDNEEKSIYYPGGGGAEENLQSINQCEWVSLQLKIQIKKWNLWKTSLIHMCTNRCWKPLPKLVIWNKL